MLCQSCHKNVASVRYAEVADGQVMDLHLCKDCLARRQADEGTGFELAAPTVKFAKSRKTPISPGAPMTQTCSRCRTSLQQIIDAGIVGCPTCYKEFPAQLESLLEGLHIGLAYRGKAKGTSDDARTRIRADLQAKRSLLKSALRLENYEEAAALRDGIHQLEATLKQAAYTEANAS